MSQKMFLVVMSVILFFIVMVGTLLILKGSTIEPGFVVAGQTAVPPPGMIFMNRPVPTNIPLDCTSSMGAAQACQMNIALVKANNPAIDAILVQFGAKVSETQNGVSVVIFDATHTNPRQ